MRCYKYVRPDSTAWRDGTTRYDVGQTVEVADCDSAHVGPCGRGLHVSPHPWQCVQYGDDGGRIYEVTVADADVIARDDDKLRVRAVTVLAEFMVSSLLRGDLVSLLRSGSGYGDGYGDGSGSGSGYGDGSGDGSGSGDGYGDGSGSGYGYGYGSGYGDGYGDGSGYGDGYGDGSGDGYGYGSGYGDGYGDGSGDGYGDAGAK